MLENDPSIRAEDVDAAGVRDRAGFLPDLAGVTFKLDENLPVAVMAASTREDRVLGGLEAFRRRLWIVEDHRIRVHDGL